ncbi:DgyrCDS7392 [Dimorphilus gyrociliatus]|uniref:DgyrCDS7392 n=1 Tax=Dimorphilus gyrociliatus TaxID=2664684 RepID=A0A7I8VVV5_9ANNE|nr:DgyrCDS7392 [Dimorphilus gyrociliatus]
MITHDICNGRLEAAVDELAFNASRLSEKINSTGLTGLSYLPSFNGLPDTPLRDADLPENARHLRDEFTERELEIENLKKMKNLSSEEDLRRKSTSKIPRPNSGKRRQSDSSLKASRENLDAGKNDDALNEIKYIKETAEKLSSKFCEMIHQDSEGEVDCVDITSNNVVEFKYSIEDIIDRLSIFLGRIGANSVPLDINEESEVVKRLKARIDSLYLETRQQNEEIKKLESLADQRLDELNELMEDLSKKDEELQSVKCHLSSVERPRDGSESSRRFIEDHSPFKTLREPSLGSEPNEGASIPPVDLETAQKIFELNQDIEQLQKELDTAKKSSEESKEELEKNRAENDKFREEIESLHNQIEDTMTHSKDIKQALEERISILQNELETKDSELGTLAREAKRLREELEENRSEEILQELDRVKAERDELILRKSLNTTPKITPQNTPQSSPLRLSPHSTSSSRIRPSSPGDSLGVPSPMSFSSVDYVPKGYFGALAQKMIVEHEMDKIRKDYRSKELASRYSIEDPRCPPVASPVRIGSDLRTLYALGKLDDFELLKKQVEECKSLISGITIRLDQRLKCYGRLSPSNSPDYSVLREVNMNVVNVQHIIQEVQRIISLFWVTEAGSADPSIEKRLRFKIGELECRLSARDEEYFKLVKKLRETNERKRRFQEQLIAKLDENNAILGKAQGNLEKRVSNGDYQVPHETIVI